MSRVLVLIGLFGLLSAGCGDDSSSMPTDDGAAAEDAGAPDLASPDLAAKIDLAMADLLAPDDVAAEADLATSDLAASPSDLLSTDDALGPDLSMPDAAAADLASTDAASADLATTDAVSADLARADAMSGDSGLPAACSDGTRDGLESDVDCGGGQCARCTAMKRCLTANDCQSGLCTNNLCIGDCGDGVLDGFETDVDCGGANACSRCVVGQVCKVAGDCGSGACLGGKCVATSCADILASNPSSPSGAYSIAPDKLTSFTVWCDMTTDGGGWTVVSMNGNLATQTCLHRLRNDALACGTTPSLTTDWQLAGAQQNLVPFKEILLLAYSTLPASPDAATKLTVSARGVIGTGQKTVVPAAIGGTPLSCDPIVSSLASRTVLSVDTDGYTVWGEPAGVIACGATTGGVYHNLGLDVLSPNGVHGAQGWTDNANGCGCSNFFVPTNAGSLRGYYGLR